MPNEHHSHYLELQRVRRQEPETVIFHILDILKEYKEFGNTIQIQDSASSLGELANYLHILHSPQSDKLYAWAIKIYRSLARKEPAFLPFLALWSSNCVDFHARHEAYTICTTIHSIQPALHSPELYFWSTNQYILNLIQEERFSDALPVVQVAVKEVGYSLWASSMTQLVSCKQEDPWSPQTQHHLENAEMVCEGLSHLMICLTRTGDMQGASTVAQQCLDILAGLPHPIRDLNPSLDSPAHFAIHSIRCAENRALLCLSRQLREIGQLEEAYNLVKKSFQPTITTPWDSEGSFQETLKILRTMHSTQLLRFSQLEALIHFLHSNFKYECSKMIDIYLMLCLECDKDIANSDIITCNASEIWNAFIVNSPSEPISLHPYCISVQLSTFLSINMDIVWDCIDNMIYTSGAIIHAFFTNDYNGSVAAMMTRVVKPESISTVAAKVVGELKQASIPLEPSMIEQVLTVCSGIISALKSSSEPNTHHDPTNKHNEYIHTVLAYCSILDDCGYPQDALEHAEQLARTSQMLPIDAMRVHMLRTRILKELMRYKEGVSAALDLVGAWEQLHKLPQGMVGPGLGEALDILSEMFTAAGNVKEAEDARTKADTVWAENQEYIEQRQLRELPQASITEALDDKSTSSSSDTNPQPPPIDDSSPTTGPIPTTVAQLLGCEDTTPSVMIDSPGLASEKAPEKLTLEEPIIILKITPSCMNAALAWGAFYLVALIALLMIAWQ
ncbi:hypothetical protein C8J56DRAFT_478490 [Mycena floridula]|nr:hypothetical protein C8J56DRAFT_478490 [Mycena floridula]